MDERIKELAEQAGFVVGLSANADRQIKHFAELVRQDEREQAEKQFNPDWNQQAVLVERIRELEAQQALDKKADNARELGLSYELEEFVRWSKEKEFFDAAHALPQAKKQDLQYDPVSTIHIRYGTALVDCPCCANKLTITFTDPPQKEWVGLTGEELAQLTIDNAGYPTLLTASIEAKLKEKNS